jgi:hypothetical protein
VGPFAYMTYDYLGVPNHRKGVNVQAFGEMEALVQGIGFGLIISCDAQIPMKREHLNSSWAYDDPSRSCHPEVSF